MKNTIAIFFAITILFSTHVGASEASWLVDSQKEPEWVQAGCPSFPGVLYGSLVYNAGAIPWPLAFSGVMAGDTVGAVYQWYRYSPSTGGTQATAVPYGSPMTDVYHFQPATDELDSYYIYFCKVTTPNCPNGVNSGTFEVRVSPGGDPCPTFNGTNLTISAGWSDQYTSGGTITLTASTDAYGGDHQYTWYHNGVALDTADTRYTFVWGFNAPQLIVTNITADDGGTYTLAMQDGDECIKYTNPVRVIVDGVTCGPNPTLTANKSAVCEGESVTLSLTNNTLAQGETGSLVYMLQPEGSHPTTTVPGVWTADVPGLYQFKYIVNNPASPSCYRESKVVSINVYGGGGTPTITPSATIMQYGQALQFTCSAPEAGETGRITWTNDQGQSGDIYPNTYPNFQHTCWTAGTYTYTYTLTNPQAGCSRTATCEVLWYQCAWGNPNWGQWYADNAHYPLGTAISLNPNQPTVNGMIGIMTYTIDGGAPDTIANPSQPFTPTVPGTYVFSYYYKHSDPRVTDCVTTPITKTLIIDPCASQAVLSTDKTTLKVGESATLTYNKPKSGETRVLTYTKDGGASQPLATTPAPYTFASFEPGVYVITNTIQGTGNCSTTAQVTINVYDCGEDATVTASRTMVRPDVPVTISVSSPGADETATLTVSYNGGAPQPVTAGTWSAHDEGTYTFTYSITHAYISCDRQAQVSVQVLDCDAAVTITADKAAVKSGESVQLTLSRPANSSETAELSYRLNGGAASAIPVTASPVTFTPSEAGTYTVTYSLTDTELGCSTSDETTFTVYDCGEAATISASRTSVRTDDEITLSVSAPGENETATLTVSYNGGAAVPVALSAPINYTPQEEGTYVFTYTITHNYIDCTRSAQVTVAASNCGEAVIVSADKSILTLGESVTVSFSREPEPTETPSLTYSFNGGPATPIASQSSPFSFTPDAVGVYTIVYTLDNATLGCTTNGEVSLAVYECGEDATIALSAENSKAGEPVSITTSAVGDNETATLTVSYNGGSATPITYAQSPITYTPTAAGSYTFTYSIAHAYIDCARTATATLQVYDCGVPANISADETVLKLGEDATLTLSAVSADETASLTYSLNGGQATPLNPQSSTLNFAPDAEGTYVLTYTVSHSIIDCETTSSVTIHVYDCGEPVSIDVPVTEMKVLRTTLIALSAPGADETATLTYSLNGGPETPLNSPLSSLVPFTPDEIGTYVLTYTITHPYIDCERTATATITVVEAELVFDNNDGTYLWSDIKNWWPAYNRLPNNTDSAIIRTGCIVDIPTAVTKDLTIDAHGATLTIQPQGGLLIEGKLLQAQAGDILIEADGTGNGSLVLAAGNNQIPATVQFYARSTDMSALYPTWQYMGYPLSDPALIADLYPGAVLYEWTNNPNKKVGGNWQRIDSLSGIVSPYTGYAMTEQQSQTYTLSGSLNAPESRAIALPYNDKGQYPGFVFLANSWVAPIDIASLEAADFGEADATVYIMNTGTYEEAVQQQPYASTTGQAALRGQYNTIPVHAAPYLPDALTVIPSMQGFFVHTEKPTTLALDYERTVYTPALQARSTEPTRAPQRATTDLAVTTFHVSGYGAADAVYMLTDPRFSTAFDNGWDGRKAYSETNPVTLTILSQEGPLSVAALPELIGTEMIFVGGKHKTYTLTVETSTTDLDGAWLQDMTADTMIELTDGATYRFKCGAEPQRFRIVRPGEGVEHQADTWLEKFIYEGILYIRHHSPSGTRLYNAQGQRVE